jgi:hypothetical protein
VAVDWAGPASSRLAWISCALANSRRTSRNLLTDQARNAWLANVERTDADLLDAVVDEPALNTRDQLLDGLCEHARKTTNQESPADVAAAVVLGLVDKKGADEGRPDGPVVPLPKIVLASVGRRAAETRKGLGRSARHDPRVVRHCHPTTKLG